MEQLAKARDTLYAAAKTLLEQARKLDVLLEVDDEVQAARKALAETEAEWDAHIAAHPTNEADGDAELFRSDLPRRHAANRLRLTNALRRADEKKLNR